MNASIHLLRRIVPSIVDLRIVIPHDHPSASLLGTECTATGTIVDPAGFLLTVHYAVIGAQAIQANLSDGRALPASVVAIDYASGLALLQLAEGGMPAPCLCDPRPMWRLEKRSFWSRAWGTAAHVSAPAWSAISVSLMPIGNTFSSGR